jgi:hypothetical protein
MYEHHNAGYLVVLGFIVPQLLKTAVSVGNQQEPLVEALTTRSLESNEVLQPDHTQDGRYLGNQV